MDAKTLTREEIEAHLDTPVCEIMSGIKAHIKAIGYVKAWQLCFTLKCHSLESLEKTLWAMVKKRKKTKKRLNND